jgi:sugar lactone lactonase YvrE
MTRFAWTTALALVAVAIAGCRHEIREVTSEPPRIETVAESDRQWTGIAVSGTERLFVCFPRWSDDVPVSVAERLPSGELRAYPDGVWNDWSPGGPAERRFVCVQALHVDANDDLWILDPGNPKFLGVVPGAPKLLRVDLETDEVVETFPFDAEAAPPASYLNDVRVDTERRVAYVTDSGLGAILVVDLATGFVRRRLEDHASTKSEGIDLLIEGRWWRLPDGSRPEVHADGIALTPDREWLYWQALTGRTLYRAPTEALREASDEELPARVETVAGVGASDGILFDKEGRLLLSSLEASAVRRRRPDGPIDVLAQGPAISWPDSFAIGPDGSVYFTTAQIHLGADPGQPYRIFRLRPEE